MSAAFLPIALVAYVFGVFLAGLATFRSSETARGGASALFVGAWLAHGVAVARLWTTAGGLPISNAGEYLLVLGWVVMTLHLIVWFGWRVDALGLVLPPLAALAGLSGWFLLAREVAGDGMQFGGWFLFHTAISTLGMAMLCVALAMSLIFLAQDRALKTGRTLKLLERLPSLETCDQIGHRSLLAGFVLLSLGIGTGLVVNNALHSTFWSLGLKQTFPILAWVVFAAILVARRRIGLRGRKSAYLTIAGVTLGLLTVVGMTL